MSIDQALFRHVMSHFASGVTVVTTTHAGALVGVTVSSFASLSLVPPLVLICIAKRIPSHAAIEDAGMFAVNILAGDQAQLSRRFADPQVEKFVPGSYSLSERGLPLLNGVLATLECRLAHAFPGGDHTIFVGEVIAAAVGEGQPLIYYRSGYYQLG